MKRCLILLLALLLCLPAAAEGWKLSDLRLTRNGTTLLSAKGLDIVYTCSMDGAALRLNRNGTELFGLNAALEDDAVLFTGTASENIYVLNGTACAALLRSVLTGEAVDAEKTFMSVWNRASQALKSVELRACGETKLEGVPYDLFTFALDEARIRELLGEAELSWLGSRGAFAGVSGTYLRNAETLIVSADCLLSKDSAEPVNILFSYSGEDGSLYAEAGIGENVLVEADGKLLFSDGVFSGLKALVCYTDETGVPRQLSLSLNAPGKNPLWTLSLSVSTGDTGTLEASFGTADDTEILSATVVSGGAKGTVDLKARKDDVRCTVVSEEGDFTTTAAYLRRGGSVSFEIGDSEGTLCLSTKLTMLPEAVPATNAVSGEKIELLSMTVQQRAELENLLSTAFQSLAAQLQ